MRELFFSRELLQRIVKNRENPKNLNPEKISAKWYVSTCDVSGFFELFCLQNSLIVGVQPQVSGKVGSMVGFWVANVRHSRRLSNFTERLVVGAGTKMQMRTHGKFCY